MNRITKIHIKNFKSLVDTEITFSQNCPVTCIVGLNASGKSSLIQAIDFIGQLMRGGIDGWLASRSWKKQDLLSKLYFYRKVSIEIEVRCIIENSPFIWNFSYNATMAKCTKETISVDGREPSSGQNGTHLLQLLDGRYLLRGDDKPAEIEFNYQGSLLSQLKEAKLERPLADFKRFIASICSFDMLSPRHIRGKSQKSDTLGLSGERLAGYIHTRPESDKEKIALGIRNLFPWITAIMIKGNKFGWKELLIAENVGKQRDPVSNELNDCYFARSAQHTSDGTLRLTAILAALYSNHGLILFDEIENGLNPHIIQQIVDILLQADKQLVVTTHSPEILQYFPDDLAVDAVKMTIRDEDGSTRVENFFDLPEAKEKLKVLSPGEVFLDLDVDGLANKNEPRRRA